MRLKKFDECIGEATGKKHVLLGNGFSRACRNDIFSYNSLFESADFKNLTPQAREAFTVLGTTDFEIVMRALNHTSQLMDLYGVNNETVQSAKRDSDSLRDVLVKTIAEHHPEIPANITNSEYARCIQFLAHFDKIYSINYDLLLYWTLMKCRELSGDSRDDGFRDPFDGEPKDYQEEDYVEWTNDTHSQNIHYIHGALHLFYRGGVLMKYCWSRTGIRLLEQIDTALKENRFPLIVAEGTSDQKLERIQKSNYLGHNFRSLRSVTGTMFIFGVSFSENDAHIAKQIQKNTTLKKVFVGVYGDPESDANMALVQGAQGMSLNRQARNPLTVEFYDAQSAHVW